ncbi:hypothetical protein [uncultured Jatrophihabitans sp.]|uniref:hypothetical protein n=1 Tax=uncultured Jatrophihabitans sp. TaxID=1610747 RepID=UPI0035CA8DFF
MTTKLNPDLDPDTEHTDTDDESTSNRPARRALPSFGLSATQLVGTALAAITATVAASYLGVTGTVIGAALASVLTAVGNAVYTTSLRTTRDRVREVVPLPPVITRSLPGHPREETPPTLPSPRPRPRRPSPHPSGTAIWKRAALGAIGVFVVLMAVVTGVEVVAGRPISDVVRGDSGGGTSFFGHETVRTVPPTAPTVYVTVTPKVVVTTPTVTQTAPATTTTPSAPASSSASPSGTASPTATPTATPSSSGVAEP